jgi:hypothetical protein
MPASSWRRERRLRWAGVPLAFSLCITLAGILPLAGAILPDPLWLPGLYDGGDYDDLATAAGDTGPPGVPAPTVLIPAAETAVPSPTDGVATAGKLFSPFVPRAPPHHRAYASVTLCPEPRGAKEADSWGSSA